MPVSPRDFELYSRMTGASMPTDAVSRARMAPDVYDFTRNFAKSPNILDKAGDMVKGIGRTFQRGIGAGIQADLSGAKSPYTTTSQGSKVREKKSGEGEPQPIGKTPDGQLLYSAGDLKTPHRPTSGNYGQGVTENQTNIGVEDRKSTQNMEIISGPSTVAEEISGSQSSNPDMTSVDRDVKREVRAVAGSVPLTTKEMLQGGGSDNMFTRNLEKTIAGDGMKEIGEVDGGKAKLTEFATKYGLLLDPALLKANQQSDSSEPLEGFKGLLQGSRFNDHTQMEGGEDNSRSMSQPYFQEVEEIKVDPSPNRSRDLEIAKKSLDAFGKEIVSKRATKQMLQQIEKNKQDEERIKGLNLNFGSKESQSTTNDVDNFVNLIEGSRTDLFPGRFGGKSMGVSYVPPTNGDAQVTFNYTDKPTTSKTETNPYGDATEVRTGTFGVDQGGMDYLQNQMSPENFGKYYNRAKTEAKEGEERKAGQIFGFIPVGDRVIPDQFSL